MDWKADKSVPIELGRKKYQQLLFDSFFCSAFLLGKDIATAGWCKRGGMCMSLERVKATGKTMNCQSKMVVEPRVKAENC